MIGGGYLQEQLEPLTIYTASKPNRRDMTWATPIRHR